MHIVYVTAPGGGAETPVRILHTELERLGHRVSVVYTAPPGNGLLRFPSHVRTRNAVRGSAHWYLARMVGGFRAWPLRLRGWEEAWAVYRAVREIDALEPVDLVEVTEGLPISLLCRHWTVAVRAHASDWSFRHFCRDGGSIDDRWLVRSEAKQLRRAHGVSAPSHATASHVSAFCRFPEERIHVIPYPVDGVRFHPCPAEAAPLEPAILSVGRLERRKGMDLLLAAMRRVWTRFPRTRVCLIGREIEFSHAQLRGMAPPGKGDLVELPGLLSHDQVPERYRRATIYVTATQYEALPNNVLEAMACGLPVVATRVGGVPELVEDGRTGLVVAPGDAEALAAAIERLLADEALRKDMGERGREKAVAEYQAERIALRMSHFYEQAVARKRRMNAPGARLMAVES